MITLKTQDIVFLSIITISLLTMFALSTNNVIITQKGGSITAELTARLTASGLPLHPAQYWERTNE